MVTYIGDFSDTLDFRWFSPVAFMKPPSRHGVTVGDLPHVSADAASVLSVLPSEDHIVMSGSPVLDFPSKRGADSLLDPQEGLDDVLPEPYSKNFQPGLEVEGVGILPERSLFPPDLFR